MRISERIKSLFRREPPTAEELAARAEAERLRDQIREDEALVSPQVQERMDSGQFLPPPL